VTGDGKTIAKLSGAIYGGRMASWQVYPYYRGGAGGQMDFWWYDQNGDGRADLNELYWAAYTAARTAYRVFDDAGNFVGNWDREENLQWEGYDRNNPTATTDPWYIVDPNWSSDKTYEGILTLEREIFTDFGVGLDLTWRRYKNYYETFWPYSDFFGGTLMSRNDFQPSPITIPSSFEGVDLGEAAGKSIYVWKDYVEDVYGWFTTNWPSDRYDQYYGLDLRWNKRLSNKWMFTGSVTLQDQKRHWGADYPFNPTNQWAEDGKNYAYSIGGASGKINQPIFSRWMVKVQGLYQFPWDINLGAVFSAREGHIISKRINVVDYTSPNAADRSEYIRTEVYGNSRLPTFWNVDLRLEKVLRIQDTGRIYLMVDCFNVFNQNILNRQREVMPGTLYLRSSGVTFSKAARSGEPNEVLNPRIFRFGVRFAI
jgi:hypothetical protein